MRWAALLLVALASGCVTTAPAPTAAPKATAALPALPPRGAPMHFAYETLDGHELSPATLAGRISVIGFVTTYDLASQAEARFLAGLLRDHSPRINVALLVLEPPENRPLVDAFVAALKVPYPVALADAPTIVGQGPFAGLHHVPSIVILDREGREAFRNVGLMTQEALDQAVKAVERASGP